MSFFKEHELISVKNEIDTDPLGRGYSAMSDAQVSADFNTFYRDGLPDSAALRDYVQRERFRAGTLYGRLVLVAGSRPVRAGNSWDIPPLPFGVSDVDVAITQTHITAAISLLQFIETPDIPATDSRIDSILNDVGGGASNAQAIGAVDKTAITALSQNKQSRAIELLNRPTTENTITQARALP